MVNADEIRIEMDAQSTKLAEITSTSIAPVESDSRLSEVFCDDVNDDDDNSDTES